MGDEAIDALDGERRPEPFSVEFDDGSTMRTVHPRAVGWRTLCESPLGLLPQIVDERDAVLLSVLVAEDIEPIVDAWRTHWGLGSAPESAELVWLLQRCVDEASYDLAVRGLDLGELWRERRWHLLWTVLMHLPRNSPTKERLALDEEFVERMLRRSDEKDDDEADESEQQRIRLSEFTPEVEALYMVIDRLGDVVSGLVGLGGRKPRRVSPMRRPHTAFDRVKHRKRMGEHRALAARVLSPEDAASPGFPEAN